MGNRGNRKDFAKMTCVRSWRDQAIKVTEDVTEGPDCPACLLPAYDGTPLVIMHCCPAGKREHHLLCAYRCVTNTVRLRDTCPGCQHRVPQAVKREIETRFNLMKRYARKK